MNHVPLSEFHIPDSDETAPDEDEVDGGCGKEKFRVMVDSWLFSSMVCMLKCHCNSYLISTIRVRGRVEAVGDVAEELQAGAHPEQELARRLPQAEPVLVACEYQDIVCYQGSNIYFKNCLFINKNSSTRY